MKPSQLTDQLLSPEPRRSVSGARLVIELLERQGVTHVSGIPGGANLPLYDALAVSAIKHVLARHEQGAGFITQGMARASGQAQVCFASSGPGATNLITAVADAMLDSIPLVAITGQVPNDMIGTDAFQEVDTFGLMLPITKHNWLVRSAEELLEVIPAAFRIALSGRPGPVSIDIPKDVQNEVIEISALPEPGIADPMPVAFTSLVDDMLERIYRAKKPLAMVGGGTVYAGAETSLRQWIESLQIPFVQTFMGLGAIPSDHELCLGMLGMHGAGYTNMAMEECDLLIGLGVRFDDRATGKVEAFCPNAEIIHIDIDPGEIGKITRPVLSINADVGQLLDAANRRLTPQARTEWFDRISELKQQLPLKLEGEHDPFKPYGAIRSVADALDHPAFVTTDVGQHQMWVAQAYPFTFARQWISSGGLGTMGFGLPAAIGAALTAPERKVICFTGDGSLMMNIQELATLAEEELDVKVIVLNNGHLGLVRQQQTLFYNSNLNAVKFRQPADFVLAARSMGIAGLNLGESANPIQDLHEALNAAGPCLIDIPIRETEMVFPMVAPGEANSNMIMEA